MTVLERSEIFSDSCGAVLDYRRETQVVLTWDLTLPSSHLLHITHMTPWHHVTMSQCHPVNTQEMQLHPELWNGIKLGKNRERFEKASTWKHNRSVERLYNFYRSLIITRHRNNIVYMINIYTPVSVGLLSWFVKIY